MKSKYKPRMKPNDPDKLTLGRTFLIGLGFMTAMAAWSYYNFMIPLILGEKLSDTIYLGFIGKDSTIGFIMTLDNIIAVLLQPYFGTLSDRMLSKHGRRTPFMLIGCTFGALAFVILPHLGSLGVLIGVILLFNLAMAFYRAPIVALMPDMTSPKVRSTGNAIINLMGGLGTVAGYAAPTIMGLIYGSETDVAVQNSRVAGFIMVMVVMIVGMIGLFVTVKETPTGDSFFKVGPAPIPVDPVTFEIVDHVEKDENNPEAAEEGTKSSKWDDLKSVFHEEEKSILWMLLSIFCWFFGFNAIEAFYSRYATLYLGWSEGTASMVLLLLPVCLIISAVPSGKLAERIGRKKTMIIGLIGLIICITILTFLTELVFAAILLAFAGVFWGMININSIAVVWQLAPKEKVGAYTGIYYTFSQLAAILSPIFAGLSFDLYKAINPGIDEGVQYLLLFPYVLVFMILALICLTRVKRGEANELSKEELENLKEKFGDGDD
jgi:maltose/moltooligosaccharide transporter